MYFPSELNGEPTEQVPEASSQPLRYYIEMWDFTATLLYPSQNTSLFSRLYTIYT